MSNFKVKEILEDDVIYKHISITREDGSIHGFPVNNLNPAYISFLRQLSEENPKDPHYVAWLEAGNNPEDFWTQDNEFEQPSEPKEEE